MMPHQSAIEVTSGQKMTVIPNKSSSGLIALFEGRADLAMISTSLKSEIALLKKTRPELQLNHLRNFEISRTRMAFAVHPSNPIRSASLDQIRRVLIGEITNWRELGGPNLPIRVVMVREGGGVQLALEAQLFGGASISPRDPIRVQIGTQVVKVVAQEPGALGLAQLGVLRAHKLPEILTDRTIEQQLNLVSLGEPTPAMQALINAARNIAAGRLD
jgi:phosphate transport system substrate-binding protein